MLLMYLSRIPFILSPSPPSSLSLLAVISFFPWVLAIADFVSSIVHSLKRWLSQCIVNVIYYNFFFFLFPFFLVDCTSP